MIEFIRESVYFGVCLSLISYGLGVLLKKKFKLGIFNPLLIAIFITVAVLALSGMKYDTYYESAKYLNYFLTPATICLAIPLYEQFEVLKKNKAAVFIGIGTGVFSSMLIILAFSLLFHFDHKEFVTFLPKSITTAIGMGTSEELGGYVAISATVIILTGVIGNVIGETVFRIFHIKEPIAKGIALGSSSHAIGTAKAMELGEVEGAMSSLSIVVAGLLTVIVAPIIAGMY